MVRDGQYSKLFMAQAAIPQQRLTNEQAEVFLYQILRSRWWKQRDKLLTETNSIVNVKDNRCGVSTKSASFWEVYYCDTKLHLLHSLAHHLTAEEFGGVDIARHGREFSRTFLELTRRFMGADTARDLRGQFTAHKVRARVVSPESRERRSEVFIERKAKEATNSLLLIARELTEQDEDG